MRLNTTGQINTVSVTAQPCRMTIAPMRQYAPRAAKGYAMQRGMTKDNR